MLRKLFKYEFRFYHKYMLLAMIAVAVSLLLARVAIETIDLLSYDFADNPFVTFAILPLTALIVVTIFLSVCILFLPNVLVAIRYYKNLTRDEGYLSFTLPVKPWQHVFCKTLTSLIWSFFAFLVVLLFSMLAFLPGTSLSLSGLLAEIHDGYVAIFGQDLSPTFFLIEMLLLLILSQLSSILLIVFSVSLGQLFRKHKLIGSIGSYIASHTVVRMLSSIVSVLPLFIVAFAENPDSISVVDYMSMTFIFSGILSLTLSIAMYLISCHIMTKRLNLE